MGWIFREEVYPPLDGTTLRKQKRCAYEATLGQDDNILSEAQGNHVIFSDAA